MSSDPHDRDDATGRYRHDGERDRFADQGPEQGAEDSQAETGSNSPSYKVGYGRPPKHSQVVDGQVLNPKGRPKGSKNRAKAPSKQDLCAIILEEAHRMISVNEANEPVSIPMAQAIIRSTLVVAAKGNTRAQRLAADLIRTAELENKREREREMEVALDYKKAWNRELARQKTLGAKGPAPLPHPDHVVVDLARGCVSIKGPATEEEKGAWARWERYRDELMAELRDLHANEKDPNCADPTGLENEIEGTRAVLEIIGYALDGHRDAMGLLEEVFARLRRTDPDFFDDPQEV